LELAKQRSEPHKHEDYTKVGEGLAKKLGAVKYIECNLSTRYNLTEVPIEVSISREDCKQAVMEAYHGGPVLGSVGSSPAGATIAESEDTEETAISKYIERYDRGRISTWISYTQTTVILL